MEISVSEPIEHEAREALKAVPLEAQGDRRNTYMRLAQAVQFRSPDEITQILRDFNVVFREYLTKIPTSEPKQTPEKEDPDLYSLDHIIQTARYFNERKLAHQLDDRPTIEKLDWIMDEYNRCSKNAKLLIPHVIKFDGLRKLHPNTVEYVLLAHQLLEMLSRSDAKFDDLYKGTSRYMFAVLDEKAAIYADMLLNADLNEEVRSTAMEAIIKIEELKRTCKQ
jgi:hypothetical protein